MKHSTGLVVLLVVLRLSLGSADASASSLVLRASMQGEALWSLTLQWVGASQGCEVFRERPGHPSSRLPIGPKECGRLRAVWDQALKEKSGVPSGAPSSPFSLDDEPDYELELSPGRKHRLVFEAPEDCEVLEDGDLKCTRHRLSALQQLLVELRAIARTQK